MIITRVNFNYNKVRKVIKYVNSVFKMRRMYGIA